VHRLVETFQLDWAALGEAHTLDPPSQMDDLPARKHLTGAGERAEPGGDVQRTAPVSTIDGNSLPSVESDTDREWQGGVGNRLVHEPLLQRYGGAYGRAGRAEHAQRLVTAEFEHFALVLCDHCTSHHCESCSQTTGILVPAFLGERRIPADVRDQERMDVCAARNVQADIRIATRFARRLPRISRRIHTREYSLPEST
jgi:hypothetical protein